MEENMLEDNVIDKPNQKDDLKEPPKYAVVFHNDDYTPMNYVVDLLKKYFGHNEESAIFIMLDVHENGKGVAGVYTRDIAETKMAQCNIDAQQSQHPLKVDIEPEL